MKDLKLLAVIRDTAQLEFEMLLQAAREEGFKAQVSLDFLRTILPDYVTKNLEDLT